uniref:Uncharacterized protein n=1 Tax=Cacopsylla melanoneura TaxID=428564 RepID=A0A8D9DUJ5_9HEMI
MTRAADSMDSGSISLRLCSSMTFFGGIFSYLLYVLNCILPSHSWSASSPSFYLLIERFLSSSFFSNMLQGWGRYHFNHLTHSTFPSKLSSLFISMFYVLIHFTFPSELFSLFISIFYVLIHSTFPSHQNCPLCSFLV